MQITLRINIITNFVILILLITTLLVGLQYYSSHQIAAQAIDKTFKLVANNTSIFVTRSENFVKDILNILSLNNEVSSTLDLKSPHPILDDFIEILRSRKASKSIYIGYDNGNYYEVFNLEKHPSMLSHHKPPKDSKWAVLKILTIKNKRVASLGFLNSKLDLILKKNITSHLNPHIKTWYKQAIASPKVIRTKIYKLASNNALGITLAKQTANMKAVIAIDFMLTDLESFLKKQSFDKASHIILFSNSGELIATSSKNKVYTWDKLFSLFNNYAGGMTHEYTIKSIDYYIYHSLKGEEDKLNIAIIMPIKKMMQPYMEGIKNSLYLAISVILLSIPLAFFSASLITKPIRNIMLENKKIVNREFSRVKNIKTHILELYQLSNSLVSMSESIKDYEKSQEALLDSIIKLIAEAIDSKSAYTGGHCERVPQIALMLLHVANDQQQGVFKDFSFTSKEQWREFEIGAWLHDCGKVTTPEYVVDKATKLETIYNRIHEIRTRFEVLYRDAQIVYLQERLDKKDKVASLEKLHSTQRILVEEFEFIASANIGGEYMSDDKKERILAIKNRQWIRNFDDRLGLSDAELLRYDGVEVIPTPAIEKLLSDKQQHIVKRENFNHEAYIADGFKEEVPDYLYNYGEIYNLCIEKGTLSIEERFKINEHIIMTIKMLEQIPFPAHLTKIPEYAGTHHETLIGTGYPRKLSKKDLSIPSRIMALADIFEALTASDRPYKKAKTISEAIKIMSFMVKDQHIDQEVFELFLSSGLHLKYAKMHLKPEQIDEVNISQYILSTNNYYFMI
jgi:HD-GYP domain-containing protein (c-di-GMP phosphodiesterase class II)